jgi:hypothetical protein
MRRRDRRRQRTPDRRRKAEVRMGGAVVGLYLRGELGDAHSWSVSDGVDVQLTATETPGSRTYAEDGVPGALESAEAILVIVPGSGSVERAVLTGATMREAVELLLAVEQEEAT